MRFRRSSCAPGEDGQRETPMTENVGQSKTSRGLGELDSHRLPQAGRGSHGLRRPPTGSHGLPQAPTGSHGLPRAHTGSHRLPRARTGSRGPPQAGRGSRGAPTPSHRLPQAPAASHRLPRVADRPLLNIGDHRFSDFPPPRVRRAKVHVHLVSSRLAGSRFRAKRLPRPPTGLPRAPTGC